MTAAKVDLPAIAPAVTRLLAPDALPDPVRWWEGMLLSPQHLQQQDSYWQAQLRWHLAKAGPCYWGLGEFQLDEARLAAGTVSVLRLECVMPDGTPVVFPGNYDKPLQLELKDVLPRDGSPVRVSLLMPRRHPGTPGAHVTRYDVVESPDVIDENSGAGGVAVDRLRPRIRLWAGSGVPPQDLACPLFDVVYRPDAQRAELGGYHPPMLRIGAADFLHGHALRRHLLLLRDAVWLKLRELGGDRGDDGADDFIIPGSDEARQLERARRLAAVLPRLALVAEQRDTDPRRAYELLADVVGAMAGFGLNPIAPLLDPYQHEDCEPQFRRALAYIERKLSYIDSRHALLAFEQTAPNRFERSLPAVRELIVDLRTASGLVPSLSERDALQVWLANACISSAGTHKQARQQRLSARVRPLSAEECRQRQLPTAGALFAILNELADLTDLGHRPLIDRSQPLVIEGLEDMPGPARVLLVVPHAHATSERVEARHG